MRAPRVRSIPTVTMEVALGRRTPRRPARSRPLDTGSFKTSATGTHKALKSAAKSAGPSTKSAPRPASKPGNTRQAQDAAADREEEPRGAAARRGARSRAVGERHPQAAEERFAPVAHARQAHEVARAPRCTGYSCTRRISLVPECVRGIPDCRSVRSLRRRAADRRAPVSRLRRASCASPGRSPRSSASKTTRACAISPPRPGQRTRARDRCRRLDAPRGARRHARAAGGRQRLERRRGVRMHSRRIRDCTAAARREGARHLSAARPTSAAKASATCRCASRV